MVYGTDVPSTSSDFPDRMCRKAGTAATGSSQASKPPRNASSSAISRSRVVSALM